MASAKKQSASGKTKKAPAKGGKGRGSAAAKRTNAENTRKNQQPRPAVSPRVAAILYCGAAIMFLIMILFKGERFWVPIRGFFFGVLGYGMFLIPAFLLYLGIMTGKERRMAHYKLKMFCGILIILLIGAFIYAVSAPHAAYTGYFDAMAGQYALTGDTVPYITFGSGILGTVLGYPLVAFGGQLIAVCISLILTVTLIAILTRFSVSDLAAAAQRRVKGAAMRSRQHHIERRRIRQEEKERRAFEAELDQLQGEPTVDDTSIDIPLDDKKAKHKRKKSAEKKEVEVDIADPDEPNAVDKNPLDDVINLIMRADKPMGKEGKTIVEDIAKDITKEHTESALETPSKDGANEEKPRSEKTSSRKKSKIEIPPELESAGYDPNAEYSEKRYELPPVQLLEYRGTGNTGNAQLEMKNNSIKLMDTLKSFGVNAKIVNICRGPSVTRYELQPAPGVKISKITNLSDDIALNLAAEGVRIEAPIPGKAAVGIEVPNKVVSMVSMRELIDSDPFRKAKSKLAYVLGRDISGEIVISDLAKMPHMLIAGTTGSGKSVCVNSILMSILFKAAPDEVKLILVDPKMVEFSKYKGIPHLLVPVVSDSKKAAGTLSWATSQMIERYKIFSELGCKDIDSFNLLVEKNIEFIKNNPPRLNEEGEEYQPVMEVEGLPVPKEKMSKIVIAIDELADLMMTAPGDVEDSICRIAQMGRAAGMHLILATQRPTVNVITGLIKANVPSRISLKVSSNMDSRTILDVGGGEKLIGRGDMLFSPMGAHKPVRVQGCYASDEEIEGVTSYIKKSHKAQYNAEIEEKIKKITAEEIGSKKKGEESDDGGRDADSKMEEAVKCVIDAGQASTSLLQRRLGVGYARAGRIIDDMERMGIIGPHQGSKPRDVLMSYSEWLERRNVLQNRDDE